jgi:hypothetical protein
MSVSRVTTASALAGLLTAFSAVSTEASLLRCKSDPIVLLSDGTEVDLSADIDTLPWNVTNVDYTLRVPKGLNTLLVIRTPVWLTTVERFTITADQPTGRYDATAQVKTRTKGDVRVTANLLVRLTFASAVGMTNQRLRVLVTVPKLLPDLIPW